MKSYDMPWTLERKNYMEREKWRKEEKPEPNEPLSKTFSGRVIRPESDECGRNLILDVCEIISDRLDTSEALTQWGYAIR